VKALLQGLSTFHLLASCRQYADVVESQQYHDATTEEHHAHPCHDIGMMMGGSQLLSVHRLCVAREMSDEDTRQVDESARCRYLRNIIERSLPADIFRLVLGGQFAHIHTVGGDVVGGSAQGDNGEQGYRDGKEMREVQGDGDEAEDDARRYLGDDDEELLRAVELEEGAP
jgi:hypothetical protein